MLLTSNTLQPPAEYFEGYCFAGSDFISDNEGAETYEQRTGRRLSVGNDGCYTLVRKTPQGIEIGTDGRGSMKLFLFHQGDSWAVSNSLTVLVDYLRSRGITVSVRSEILKAMMLPGSFTQQLITSQTIYDNIRLVPSFEKLIISPSGIQAAPAIETDTTLSYAEALQRHVATWRARLQTVMSGPSAVLTTDLTGGRDSRVCFAFAQASGLLDTGNDRFRLASNVRWEADYLAASRIAQAHGHELNTPTRPPGIRGSSERAVRRWIERSMGVYLPVYLHAAARDPQRLHLHGAGGGNFRPLYKVADLGTKLDNVKKYMNTKEFSAFKDTAVADMAYLKNKRPEVPELSLHYREFRNRFHFGFSPQCGTVITPLNSVLLDAVTDREGLDANDVYADIMDALVPGLKNLPYDEPSKQPRTPERSPAAKSAQEVEYTPGQMFTGGPQGDGYKPGGRQFQYWIDTVAPSLQQLNGSPYLENAELGELRDFCKAARELPRRPQANSREMKLLSFAATVAFATK